MTLLLLAGYVGDWHSHPAACGASSQDVTSIRRASRQYTEPLVLLVHRSDGTLDHVVAHRGRRRRARWYGAPTVRLSADALAAYHLMRDRSRVDWPDGQQTDDERYWQAVDEECSAPHA